uniref:HD-ZIP protein N-terminal domain-containing protein n=1 Tax=Cucumis sativus TaxID=3659 RepID=A0A0A0L5G0_CUCSA
MESGVELFADRTSETGRSLLRSIEVNRMAPSTADYEEEARMSKPSSTGSSVYGKWIEHEMNDEDVDGDGACSRRISDEKDGGTCRKRFRFTEDQSAVLKESSEEHDSLNPYGRFSGEKQRAIFVGKLMGCYSKFLQEQTLELAIQLGLRPRQVEVWFQRLSANVKINANHLSHEALNRNIERKDWQNRKRAKSKRQDIIGVARGSRTSNCYSKALNRNIERKDLVSEAAGVTNGPMKPQRRRDPF